MSKGLLIVPCGIETRQMLLTSKQLKPLLIVPCGIETQSSFTVKGSWIKLLIVPCGIETKYADIALTAVKTFNRTMWN